MDNFLPQGAVESKLSDVCRSCLCRSDDATPITPNNDNSAVLIAMLSSVGNIEVEMDEGAPCVMCKSCEEKLRFSYDFQMLIQKSNQIIRKCLKGEVEEVRVVFVPETKNTKQTTRLPQFSPDAVAKAIERSKEGGGNHACIKCGFVTSNNRALSVHMAHLHKELKERWCSTCNLQIEDLPAHLEEEHNGREHKCEFCSKLFLAKGHLTEHLRCHSNVRPFKCPFCDKGFVSSRHLNNHMQTHSDVKQHRCPHCSKEFAVASSLRHHLKIAHKEKGTIAELDDVGLTPQNFCAKCGKKVRSLSLHLDKHHGDVTTQKKERVLCTVCGKQFKTASKLRVHMRIHTGELPYKCSYCDKRMSSRNQLVVHERVHTGVKPHICNFCGKAFAQSSVLNTHMKIHTGRPEVCEICEKRFCRPAQLRLHLRKHTGEKPYLCTQCGQGFKQRSHLMEHQKTHSDERPFKCDYCEKSFKQNSSLKSHIQIHLGYKPFKCSQCAYACRQSYSLTQHMKQHIADAPRPENPHLCQICQKGYNTFAMLTSHMSLVHEIDAVLTDVVRNANVTGTNPRDEIPRSSDKWSENRRCDWVRWQLKERT